MLFLAMSITIESVPLERANIRVCLMVFLAARTLKEVGVQLALPCFQSRWIHFFIGFVIPCELLVMLWFVRTIAFNTFGPLNNTRKLNRVLVTKCLPYIHLVHGLCYTNLAYSKKTCIIYTIDIWYNIIAFRSFYIFLCAIWL